MIIEHPSHIPECAREPAARCARVAACRHVAAAVSGVRMKSRVQPELESEYCVARDLNVCQNHQFNLDFDGNGDYCDFDTRW